ncbi:hypothetical protein AB6A40_011251 [Gnathostoma spinigerum]|uniref:Uncharacterized protein n=1 Tax=Gnathostoma spinigerum TaxID=75299 RepID=A0ABD6F3T5_9BILA
MMQIDSAVQEDEIDRFIRMEGIVMNNSQRPTADHMNNGSSADGSAKVVRPPGSSNFRPVLPVVSESNKLGLNVQNSRSAPSTPSPVVPSSNVVLESSHGGASSYLPAQNSVTFDVSPSVPSSATVNPSILIHHPETSHFVADRDVDPNIEVQVRPESAYAGNRQMPATQDPSQRRLTVNDGQHQVVDEDSAPTKQASVQFIPTSLPELTSDNVSDSSVNVSPAPQAIPVLHERLSSRIPQATPTSKTSPSIPTQVANSVEAPPHIPVNIIQNIPAMIFQPNEQIASVSSLQQFSEQSQELSGRNIGVSFGNSLGVLLCDPLEVNRMLYKSRTSCLIPAQYLITFC